MAITNVSSVVALLLNLEVIRPPGGRTTMADNTGTTQTQKSANARKASTRRSTAATKRSTAAKKAAQTRAQRSGATARRRTSTAAKSRATSAQTTTGRQADTTLGALAERAALTYVGAALVARDNVIETVDEFRTKYGTRSKAERKLETQLNRFERRGDKARRSLEREVKRTRTRVERELRQRRNRVRRQVRPLVRDARSQSNLAGARAENLGVQLQSAVQTGLTAGTELAAKVQERVAALA